MSLMSIYIVFVTAPKNKESRYLANLLLEKKLCACVNIIKSIDSFFWWRGKIDTASEDLLMIKTTKRCLPKLIKTVKANHSYEVCEVVAVPVIAGNKDYLSWVSESCNRGSK